MKRHRIFIAINPPQDIQQELFAVTNEWRELPIRWTKPENIHITLHFMGNVDDDTLAHIAEVLPLAAEGIEQFEIVLSRIGIGPEKGKKRMVWADGEAPKELAQLQQQVQEAVENRSHVLENVGMSDDNGERSFVVVDPERSRGSRLSPGKPFRFHVTLGRMIPFKWNRLQPVPHIARDINTTFPVSSVELMESELGPGGPMYTILSSVELP